MSTLSAQEGRQIFAFFAFLIGLTILGGTVLFYFAFQQGSAWLGARAAARLCATCRRPLVPMDDDAAREHLSPEQRAERATGVSWTVLGCTEHGFARVERPFNPLEDRRRCPGCRLRTLAPVPGPEGKRPGKRWVSMETCPNCGWVGPVKRRVPRPGRFGA